MKTAAPEERSYDTSVDCIVETDDSIVLGSYSYDEDEVKRSGKLQFVEKHSRSLQKEVETSGTLDMCVGYGTIYSANAGTILAYSSNETKVITTKSINTKLDFSENLAVVDISGTVAFFDTQLELIHQEQLTNQPLWTVKIIDTDVFAGAEDGTLFCYDRARCQSKEICRRRAGIIDIVKNEHNNILYVSSYDEQVEGIDLRTGKTEMVYKDVGTLWRMKMNGNVVHAASMYDGYRLYDRDFRLIESHRTNSICYGLLVTEKEIIWSSFYEKNVFFLLRNEN